MAISQDWVCPKCGKECSSYMAAKVHLVKHGDYNRLLDRLSDRGERLFEEGWQEIGGSADV